MPKAAIRTKAFTLIELLVVVSIIALLSSVIIVLVDDTKAKARDSRRQFDLGQLDRAIAAYYNANGNLPRTTGWCTYISNQASGWDDEFRNDLVPTYIPAIPLDPMKAGQVGDYFYRNDDDTAGKYTLCADLDRSTGQSYDYSGTCAGGTVYDYCVRKQ